MEINFRIGTQKHMAKLSLRNTAQNGQLVICELIDPTELDGEEVIFKKISSFHFDYLMSTGKVNETIIRGLKKKITHVFMQKNSSLLSNYIQTEIL